MGHRKWSQEKGWMLFSAEVNEHNALYDIWRSSERRVVELLDENNRLDRELDEARKRIAELESPLRVPFSDAQIERMAIAASDAYSQYWIAQDFPKLDYPRNMLFRKWEEHGEKMKESRILMIRAALAAGGLEPCPAPEYDPADVALRPSGHVLRDRLVEAERKVENQRAELKRLNALVADLRDQIDDDNTNAAAVNDLLVQVQNLTAALRDRDAVPAGVLSVEELDAIANDAWEDAAAKTTNNMERQHAMLAAIRDAVLAGVGQPSSNAGQFDADEVEALARVIRDGWDGEDNWKYLEQDQIDAWTRAAHAAIAHLRKRPEGLPTREQIAKISYDASPSVAYMGGNFVKWEKLSGGQQNIYIARADAILAALAPYLRDPVGWELDVTAEEVSDMVDQASFGCDANDIDLLSSYSDFLDLCRSRIQPKYECPKCSRRAELGRQEPISTCERCNAMIAYIENIESNLRSVRAALEDE